ncbi:hypothetical protein NQ317_008640 [Molorchus minor]|uniref:DRBM domain-containing protein n=1 Tax=Molorchus minor TaxID=1323400 RepID=A0ABQ9K0Q8_9CUCU|nr:hypothetical protein NQ317_008640 [Molorchus minor]
MSYNTRRTGGFCVKFSTVQSYSGTPQQQLPTNSVGSIGQRRPVVTNNFVAGGQANNEKFRSKASGLNLMATKLCRSPPQFRLRLSHPRHHWLALILPIQLPRLKLKKRWTPRLREVKVPKKRFWNRGANKITKREKVRRRNIRLSKMLQPKNAVMILNELVKNTLYTVKEVTNKTESNQFVAAVLVEGVEYQGYGRSKIQAKNTAAENALKALIKSNKLSEMKKDEEGNEKMDVSEDGTQPPLPWQHVASFALFKLFTSWGEDPNCVKGISKPVPNQNNGTSPEKPHENKPAKKLPDNPELMNPLMLINQMIPQAQFEEIGRSGNPPNVMYSYRCSVNNQAFIGTGSSKKAAKRQAAFGRVTRSWKLTIRQTSTYPSIKWMV